MRLYSLETFKKKSNKNLRKGTYKIKKLKYSEFKTIYIFFFKSQIDYRVNENGGLYNPNQSLPLNTNKPNTVISGPFIIDRNMMINPNDAYNYTAPSLPYSYNANENPYPSLPSTKKKSKFSRIFSK